MLISEISSFLNADLHNPKNLDLTTLDIEAITSLKSAKTTHLSFYDKSRPLQELLETKACAVILEEKQTELTAVQLIIKNPKLAMCEALSLFVKKKEKNFTGISEKAYVHPEAKIHETATIYPLAFIDKKAKVGAHSVVYPNSYIGEEVRIGEHSLIYSNVSLMNACQLGNHVVILPGTVIGTEGFGFIPTGKEIKKVPQVGQVVIEDHVQVGSLCNIDSATFDKTTIKEGTKIDGLVKIGHNVSIGKHNILCSQVGLSGGATLGDHVIVAGQAGFNTGITVESHTTIGGKAGVTHSLKSGTYHGFPVTEAKEWRRMILAQKKVPQLLADMRKLQKRLKLLEEELEKAKQP